jgi:hypothetical protein
MGRRKNDIIANRKADGRRELLMKVLFVLLELLEQLRELSGSDIMCCLLGVWGACTHTAR